MAAPEMVDDQAMELQWHVVDARLLDNVPLVLIKPRQPAQALLAPTRRALAHSPKRATR